MGQKQPNSWGLYDMLGNVWQWTADWYGPYVQDSDDTQGPTGGDAKTLRGGSWSFGPRIVRVSSRGYIEPSYRSYSYGFRCVGE